jgi:hypothetical protein
VSDFVLLVASAVMVALVLGVVWYSPFGFGDAWSAAIERQRAQLRSPARAMAASFVSLVASAVALGVALRLLGISGVSAGAFCGLLAGGIVTAATLSDYLFAAQPLSLFAVQALFRLAYLVVMGVVYAAWP